MPWVQSDFVANGRSFNGDGGTLSDGFSNTGCAALCDTRSCHSSPAVSSGSCVGIESGSSLGSSRNGKRTHTAVRHSKKFKSAKEFEGPNKCEEMWIHKHAPESKVDLAVNSKKISEVEAWMKSFTDYGTSRVLVLTGPPGAGKSTTVRVLAKELNLNLLEWDSPSVPFLIDGDNSAYESQASLFRQFLCRSSKYGSVERLTDESSSSQQDTIVLVEDIPQFCVKEPEKMREILRHFVTTATAGFVLVLTESFAGNSQFWQLFPPGFVDSLSLRSINFNPMTTRAMKKVLSNIVKAEFAKDDAAPSSEHLDEVIAKSNGDLRGAVMALQFMSDFVSHGNKRKRCKTFRKLHSDTKRDESLLLFRAVGRVFHVKRCSEKPVDLLGLQNHNLSSARHPLTYIPEETVERCTSSPDTFISFLHDNYPCYYPNDLHKVEVGSEWLSLTDCIGGGDWVNRESTIVYAVSAAVRGLMHLYESDTVSKPFRAIGKPFASVARRKIDERKAIGREIALAMNAFLRDTAMFSLPFFKREFVREHEFVETKTMDTDETPQRQIPPPVLSGESISSEMEAIDLDTWEAIEDTRQFRWPKESPSLAVTVNFTAVCAGTAGADPTMIEDYDDES